MYKTILITGCCGFIGYHTTLKLLQKKNVKVIGLDNINNHYDVKIKKDYIKVTTRKTGIECTSVCQPI
jgi:UDP-glucuronate 4-epimerase